MVPPAGVLFATPLHMPLQLGFAPLVVTVNADGWVIVDETKDLQLFASFTVIV